MGLAAESPKRATPSDGRIGRADIFAGLAFAGDLFFWHLSIVTTSVANATFFATCAPIWVVAFGWLLLRRARGAQHAGGRRPVRRRRRALLAQSFHLRPAGAIGDLYGIATGVFFGLYFLAVKAARRAHSAARVTFVATVITAALLLIVALALDHAILPHSLRGIGALIGMAWISHAGGQGLLSIALGRLPAAFSSLVIFLEAIAAAGFAFLLLGEPVSLVQGLGGLLILAGIYVARPTGGKAAAARRAAVDRAVAPTIMAPETKREWPCGATTPFC